MTEPPPLGRPQPSPPRAAAAWLVLAVALGAALEGLSTPPGPAPALVFVFDAPFLGLLFAAGTRWKRWAFAYGFVRFATGLWWLWYVHPGMIVGAAAILGGAQVLFGAAIRLGVRLRAPYVAWVAGCVVGLETFQTVLMGASGMPWPARSLAFAAWDDLLGFASVFGGYGLSAIAGATSAWASGLLSLRHADGYRVDRARALVGSGLLLAALVALGSLYGGAAQRGVRARLEGPAAVAVRTDPIVIVQASIGQDMKNARDRHPQEILDRHLDLTREALDRLDDEGQRAIAVLWPETMIPWPFLDRGLSRRFPERFANQFTVLQAVRSTVPSGQPARFLLGVNHFLEGRARPPDPSRALEDHETTDAVVFVDLDRLPDEAPDPADWPESDRWPWEPAATRHEKAVLVPWGEYAPGGRLVPFLRQLRDLVSPVPEITAGDADQAPFLLALGPPERSGGANRPVQAGSVVCFEIAFPARCRAWRLAGATVLLNAGNYGWYGDSTMPAQVLALARLRAVELAVTVAVAGNTGPSAVVDPSGRVRAEVVRDGRRQYVEGWCAAPLHADPGYETPYLRWGDAPLRGAILALSLWALGRALTRRRRARDTAVADSGAPSEASSGGGAAADRRDAEGGLFP